MIKAKMIKRVVKYVSVFIAGSLVLSLFYYILLSLFICTDVEKQLRDENRLYREELPQVEEYASLVGEEITFLRMRDEEIYRQVFKAEAPQVGSIIGGDILSSDDLGRGTITERAWNKSTAMMESASRTEDNWRAIYEKINERSFIAPPLLSPVENLHYTNVGASVGNRMNPFYKVNTYHSGMDLIAAEGTPVLATCDGWVEKVQDSQGGRGKMVEISHLGGYVTRYAHLLSVSVKKGSYVHAGSQVGLVGDSGRSFTTHLHYEVLKDSQIVDPANFLICSLDPFEYLNILIMSASSGQSMD